MTSSTALHISHLTPTDSDELLATVRQIQQDDPLRPVTVVAPSNYALLSLRHRLGRSGIANVRFMVFPRLAELLGAPLLSAQGRRPLTSIINSAIVRSVASEATGMLEPLRDHPSTHLSLRHTFRQLRHATDDALDSLAAQGGLRAETVALYRLYRKRVAAFYDPEDLAEAATKAVRSGSAYGLDDLGSIVFFRVRGLTPSQTSLVEALAEDSRCTVLLGKTGDPYADASTDALAIHLRPALGEPLTAADSGTAQHSPDSHLLVAPNAHQEIRWVIRRIMQRAEAGTPFHRMAVLYRKEAPYGTLIREELALARIPVAGPNTASLADTAVGSALIGLLGMQEADFSRDNVMAWLTGSPLKPPPGIDPASFNPTLWDTISKKANVVRGAENWEQRLIQFADNQESAAREWEQAEIYESRAFRMRADAEVARQLHTFISDLIESASPAAGASWNDYSDWAKDLLDRYLAPYDSLPPAEQRAYDRIERILDELKAADEISPNPSFDVFRRALNEALQASVGHLGSVGHGVFVAPLKLAAAMSFDVVHIVGMIEGAVPPAVRDDPLIPERDRERAGGSAAGLPLQQQQKDDERYDYLAALATAPERTLSYPVADPAGQRENFPSRWLLEEASRLAEVQIFSSTLPEYSGSEWMTVIRSMRHSFETAQVSVHADGHDYNMERLQSWKSAGLRPVDHPLAAEDVLAASMRLSAARLGRRFTEWDGNLSAAGTDFGEMLTGRPLSPTSLERWAKCPFSYFLGTVLRLSAEDSPEDIYEISPMERGLLIHDILEKFVEAAKSEGSLPAPQEEWTARHRAEMRRIAALQFEDTEAKGVAGKSVMWQIARDEILIDLDAFLDADLRMRQQFGVSPMLAEAEFGIGHDGWRPAVLALSDGTQVSFRGKIDRVDTDGAGGRALVLDYKTGGSYSYRNLKDDPIDRGQHLQLAIYSLAARQALGERADVSAAYWFVTSGGKFDLVPAQAVNIEGEGVMERFSEGISTIVVGIRQGMFPANPGPGDPNSSNNRQTNCRFCDFKTLCPSRRDVQWQRKSRASALTNYLRLTGDEP